MSGFNDAPTPQNTPASVGGSYMQKAGNPATNPSIPTTINESNELLQGLLSNNPALLHSIQAKLGELVGTDSGYFESLPEIVKDNVYALKSLQLQQYKIEAEFQAELLELERKFQKLYEPIFEARKNLVTGTIEPSQKEIEIGKKAIAQENDEDEDGDDDKGKNENDSKEEKDEDTKGIPFFWLTAMQNLPPIADMISDRDVEVLKHLIDVKLEYMEKPGFKLIFEFKENPFFSNKTLEKTYYYQKELGYTGEFVYDHAEGDDIQWTDNKHNVTLELELRKQRNKHTKQIRTIEKATPTFSFFNFFTPPQLPTETDEDDVEIDEELEEALQNDYSIGELIKEKLLPRAVDWFTGHALKYEPEFGEDGEDEFDDEEDEGGDEDSSDDEDDEDEDSDDDIDDTQVKKELEKKCDQQ
ncbi:hypothetical protein CANINC_001976 [Pichia inconspicua]|uniref:Nucleosome assembly protein n=1 Tax=Pichia inconspicua TaxID=52247 RepID=A0A4T0X2R3_9ASCO|nr:hypothetical protein CANINC_001976 [[Candida] inconspicua]